MPIWKPILLIVPAGLVLGAAGAHLAHPVLPEPAASPWQSIFQTRAEQYGRTGDYPSQADGPMDYVGGYSYAPDVGMDKSGWSPPSYQPDWTYADVPLPTVAELDARQAALLADPDVEFAVHPPPPNEPEDNDAALPAAPQAGTPQLASAAPDNTPEPRTADGELPAIW